MQKNTYAMAMVDFIASDNNFMAWILLLFVKLVKGGSQLNLQVCGHCLKLRAVVWPFAGLIALKRMRSYMAIQH